MKQKNNRGFTLLELLIAISLSVIIFVILFASLRLGHKSQEKGTQKAEELQKLRIIGDRITWLIRGTYPFTVKKPDSQKIYFKGDSGSIGFVTTSTDSFGKGPEDIAGLKWVSIFTENDGMKIREKVFFLEDVFDDSGGKVYVLDPDVKKMELEYLDVPEDKGQGDWVSEWDPADKQYLPSAVKVKITFEFQKKTIVMPEIIVRINAYKKLQ